MANADYIVHPFEPVFDADSRILILGSLPSPDSRKNGFYYGHARNRFWKVLAQVTGFPAPQTVEEKIAFAYKAHIALYDVIAACEIIGASDASIKNVQPADLSPIFAAAKIQAVFCSGTKAYQLYLRWQKPLWDVPVFALPSTSPANAAWSAEKLAEAYRVILPYL